MRPYSSTLFRSARDGLRHRELLRAEAESRERASERAAVAENRGELGVGRAGGSLFRERCVQCGLGFAFADAFFLPAGFAAGSGLLAAMTRMPAMRSRKSSYGLATRAL